MFDVFMSQGVGEFILVSLIILTCRLLEAWDRHEQHSRTHQARRR